MTEVCEKAINLITAQKKKKQSGIYPFFQSLLYGALKQSKQIDSNFYHYNIYTRKASECLIYLHEHHIGIMVCVDKSMTGIRSYFNIKNIEISQFSYEYELDKNIEKHKYLVLKEKHDFIILLFQNTLNRNYFKDNLQKLKKIFIQIPDSYDPMILKAFIKADSNQNGQISWSELKNLVRMMKVDLNREMKDFIKKILGKQTIKTIEFSQFERLWKIFYCRNELTQVFEKYNREEFHSFEEYLSPKLDVKEFQKFLIEEQKQTEQSSKKIIEKLYQRQNFSLSFYDFCLYIFGPTNNLLNDDYKSRKIDMSKPLNHYYCYSSHNTYLTGDQLFSDSRIQRYLVDLENGLRCVQIDVHDSSQGPIVKHGYTPTSSILFKDVIESVKRFIDLNPNHTPIILSLQNHCNSENQQLMADILKSNFTQNQIVTIDHDSTFPTLKQCMNRIVIKGPGDIDIFKKNQKQMQTFLDGQFSDDQQGQDQAQQWKQSSELNQQNTLSTNFNQTKQTFFQVLANLKQNKKQFLEKKNEFRRVKKQPTEMQKMLQSEQQKMAQLIMVSNSKKQKYHEKYKVSGKLLSIICMLSKGKLQRECYWQSNSFSQNKLLKFYNDPKTIEQIRKLSNLKWFRSYPDGFRILSSNYDPIPALQLGIQIVAINTQSKNDVNSHILKSFFTKGSNLTTGYREKVNFSRKSDKTENISERAQDYLQQNGESQSKILTKVKLRFISGLRIYQNEENDRNIPPVQVKAYFTGSRRDNRLNQKLLTSKEYTEVIYNQSFNPKFNKSEAVQIKCIDPQLGFLVVEVPECGRSVIPIDCMKNGWRVISLYDETLKQKQSKLLCRIELTKSTISVQAEQ